MDKSTRQKMIVAMEFIARTCNDERVFNRWLSLGVADGDIPAGSLDPNKVDEYYTGDKAFSELMGEFLKLMSSAEKHGGLYCDQILSRKE